MNLIRRILSTQPILLTRVLTSVAALAIAYGAPITDGDVNNAVEAVATLMALGNVLLALVERQTVYSPATHDADVESAFAAGAEGVRSGRLV
jgi:hypothetical protein